MLTRLFENKIIGEGEEKVSRKILEQDDIGKSNDGMVARLFYRPSVEETTRKQSPSVFFSCMLDRTKNCSARLRNCIDRFVVYPSPANFDRRNRKVFAKKSLIILSFITIVRSFGSSAMQPFSIETNRNCGKKIKIIIIIKKNQERFFYKIYLYRCIYLYYRQ